LPTSHVDPLFWMLGLNTEERPCEFLTSLIDALRSEGDAKKKIASLQEYKLA
jgi:hypothetical protein